MSDYGSIIGVQCPGALGDSSKYNIDGACFTASDHDSVMVGKIVRVKGIVDGYKEITDVFTENDIPYGVSFRSHMNTSMDETGYMVYMPGDPINVISNGRAWVLTENIDQAPQFGTLVKVGADGFANANGFEIPGWHYTGGWQKWNGLFYIVEIQINQSAPFIYAGQKTLVNGAVLTANLPSPQAPNKVITITVEVSPKDADDKTGSWYVDNDQCEIRPISETQAYLSVKNGGPNDVHVTWSANDGSGVQSMIEYTFIDAAP